MIYSTSFYEIYYEIFKKHILSQDDVPIEPVSILIEKTLIYLKRSEYLDQKDFIPWAPRTLAAVSGIDFIFDLLSELKEEELQQLLISSKKELIEIIQEVKLLISGEGRPVHIDDKNVIFNVLSAWTRCILIMIEKIVEYSQNKQHLDYAPAVRSFKKVSDQIQETEKHFTEPADQLSKQVQEPLKPFGLTPKTPEISPRTVKNTNHTEWILKEILIGNIVELYERLKCSLTFKPESKTVVLGVEELGRESNIRLASEKSNEIYEYLQGTKLQKYLIYGKRKTSGADH